MEVDPDAPALLQQRLDELGIRNSSRLSFQSCPDARPRHGRLEEGPHVRQVLRILRLQRFDLTGPFHRQGHLDGTLGDDEIDTLGQDAGQPEHVLARGGARLVEGVDDEDDGLAGLDLVATVGCLLEQALEEIGTAGRTGQHAIDGKRVQLPDPDDLGRQVPQAGRDPLLTSGQLAEVVDVAAILDQVSEEGRLAQAGLGLEDEDPAIMLLEKSVESLFKPISSREPIDLDPLEDGPGGDKGLPKPGVVFVEDLGGIDGDRDPAIGLAAADQGDREVLADDVEARPLIRTPLLFRRLWTAVPR